MRLLCVASRGAAHLSLSRGRGRRADTDTSRPSRKGVAILFTNHDDKMVGEGLALGYLLMSMGAVTPERLEGVHAVFVHRNDSFAQLEPLYAELVNLPTHSVEYFRFGGGQPVEEIFCAGASLPSILRARGRPDLDARAGYLVVPTLTALRHAASYERFCSSVRDVYARTCQLFVHPATIGCSRSPYKCVLRTFPSFLVPP